MWEVGCGRSVIGVRCRRGHQRGEAREARPVRTNNKERREGFKETINLKWTRHDFKPTIANLLLNTRTWRKDGVKENLIL